MLEGVRTTVQDTCSRMFAQPYTRISNIVNAGIAKRQTTSSYLQALGDVEILEEHALGKQKLFLFPRLIRVLTQKLDE